MNRFVIFKVFLIFAGLILACQSFAQFNNHLILKKGAKNKIHFLRGDSIVFMRNDFKTPYREQIQAIGEDFIVIRGEELAIKDITGIVKTRALHFKAAGHAFKIAGPGLILIGIVNSLFSGQRPLIVKNIAIVSAALVATGFLLPHLQTKVYYMKRGYYLRIVPSDPETIRTPRRD